MAGLSFRKEYVHCPNCGKRVEVIVTEGDGYFSLQSKATNTAHNCQPKLPSSSEGKRKNAEGFTFS